MLEGGAMPERGTLGNVLMHVGIASAVVIVSAFFAVGVRGLAIRSVRQEVELRDARDADLERRAAASSSQSEKSAILGEALLNATSDVFDPVATRTWRVATWVALGLLGTAVLLGSAWTVSRTDWIPAGIAVYLVGVVAWVMVAFVAHSVLKDLPAVRELLDGSAPLARSVFRSGTQMRMLELLVGGIAFDASAVLRAMVVIALPASAGISAGRKLAVASRSDREFEPVLFEPVTAPPLVAEPAVRTEASTTPGHSTGVASWDPVEVAVAASSGTGLVADRVAGSSGLCPRCGAVNNPRNIVCIMCETALQ